MKKIVVFVLVIFSMVLLACSSKTIPPTGEAIELPEESIVPQPFIPEVTEVIEEQDAAEQEVQEEVSRKEVVEATPLTCGQTYFKGGRLLADDVVFRYDGTDSETNTAFLVNEGNGLTNKLPITEKSLFTLKKGDVNIGFMSTTNFTEDDYGIIIRYPCSKGTECNRPIEITTIFDANNNQYQYTRSRGYTFDRQGQDKTIQIRDTIGMKDVILPTYLGAVFQFSYRGKSYLFENAPDEEYNKNNFPIRLVYPCG